MSVNEKMTAIANEVRELAGVEDALGLDAMATNVGEANEEIALQEELLAQALEELKSKADPELYTNGYVVGYQDLVSAKLSGDVYSEAASLRGYIFNGCPITSADLPNVTSIVTRAFSYCSKLNSINAPKLTSLGTYAFQGCGSLGSISFPELKSLGGYIFQSCGQLKDVYLPKLTSVGTADFYGCDALKKLDFPSVTKIGSSVFTNSKALSTLILRSETVCTLDSAGSFNGTPIANGTGLVYVPDDLVEQYKTATNWSTFAAQIKPISELGV